MEEHTGFAIDIEEINVNLIVPQGNKDYKVTHVLKIPTEGQLVDYDKKTGGVRMKGVGSNNKGGVLEYGGETLKAACDLWRQLIVRVEGYKGGPYAPQRPNWQTIEKKIPANHKRAAVNQVVSTAGLEGEEKND